MSRGELGVVFSLSVVAPIGCGAFVGSLSCADLEGRAHGGGPSPLKSHKTIGFLSNTGLHPLKITNLSSQQSMLGHHGHGSKTPFKWCSAGGPMMARL